MCWYTATNDDRWIGVNDVGGEGGDDVPVAESHRRQVGTLEAASRWVSRWFLWVIVTLACGGCSWLRPENSFDVVSADASPVTNTKAHAAFKSGVKHYRHGKLDLAERDFIHAVELDPTHGRAHNNLGLVYFEQHRLARAASAFDTAVMLRPEDPTPLNNLGMALEAGGRAGEAIEFYAAAAQLSPDEPKYLGNLVRSKVRMGDRGELVHAQLQQLAMIEYRPDWLRWVHDQLALDFNPLLDRGNPNDSDGWNSLSASNEGPRDEEDAGSVVLTPQEVEWLPAGVLSEPVVVESPTAPPSAPAVP
ncbi:tetratricopeptide repeat protein [Crateriforma spongiae]|uniref:tetratricopeptide repeat protein n=1 Tax=Crateriforma spongiae TaxID=2724528 RepID=UPI001447F708|nr:tetratricopeptide repeat protein [Crateriforma spongiae]